MKMYLASDGLGNGGKDSWALYVETADQLLSNYQVTWSDGRKERISVTATMPVAPPEGYGAPRTVPALLQVWDRTPTLCDIDRPYFTMSPQGYELQVTQDDLIQASQAGLFTLSHQFGLAGTGRVKFEGLDFEQVLALESERATLQSTAKGARGVLFGKRDSNEATVVFLDRSGNATKPVSVTLNKAHVELRGNLTAVAINSPQLPNLMLKASDVMDFMFTRN